MFRRFFYIEGLTNLIDSDNKYLINIQGQVKDKLGNDIPFYLDENGYKIVHVQSWDGVRDYRIIDLVALQFKNIQIPKKDYDKVVAFVIDGSNDSAYAGNVGYRFKNGKLEVDNHPGFYYVPGYPYVAINKNGDLLDLVKNIIKEWYITKPNETDRKNTKYGYRATGTKLGPGMKATILRHRALGLVFLDFPNNSDDLVINHKDGTPGNDWIDNLEWITRGQNNIHAYVNDLKNQHMRVLARNVLTGEIQEHYSVSECARAFKYGLDTIRFRLRHCDYCQVFGDGFQFKYKNDPRDWIIPIDPHKAITEGSFTRKIKVRNCNTLEETIYDSILMASEVTNINNSTISFRLNTNNCNPLMGFQFKDVNDKTSWPSFTKEQLEQSLIPKAFGLNARNLLTGETKYFISINSCRKMFPGDISHLLAKGKQPLYPNGWQFKYENDEWIEIEDIEETLYKLNKDITALEVSTNKLIIADSARQMSEVLNLDPKAIRVASFSRGNKIYHGYRFRLGISSDPWPNTI